MPDPAAAEPIMPDPMTAPDGTNDAESTAKPPHGADDGKAGGRRGGAKHAPNFPAPTHGTNAQSCAKAGTEDERTAPGISTDKKADDTK